MSLFLVFLMVLSNFPTVLIDEGSSKVSALEVSQLAVVVKGVDEQDLTEADVKLILGEEQISTAVYDEFTGKYLFSGIQDLSEGEYSIIINHDGYVEKKIDITLPDDMNSEMIIEMSPILVTSLTIKKPEVEDYYIASKYQFSTEISPTDALNKEIQWACSSDKATIDSNGLLSISEEMEESVIKITATALGSDPDNIITEEVEITVKNGPLNDEDYTLSSEPINNWFNSDVTISPNASGSNGYDKIKIEGEWLDSYTTTFEGTEEVEFYLKNSATGVISKKKTLSLNIDKTAPEILDITVDNSQWATSRNITFNAKDLQSGISKVYWSKEDNAEDGNIIEVVDDYYSFDVTENGTYYIYAVDIAGNKTKIDVEVNKLDNTKPEIIVSKDPENKWSNTVVRISGQVPRLEGTALSSVKYSTNADFTDARDAQIKLDETGSNIDTFIIDTDDIEGEMIYYIKAYDEVGNESETVQVEVKIDKHAPTIKESDFVFEYYDTFGIRKVINILTFGNFCNDEIQVTIKAEDNLSGVDKIIYYTSSDEGGLNELSYKGEISVNNDGEISFELPVGFEGYVFAKAIDKVGNVMQNYVRAANKITIEDDKPSIDIYIDGSNDNYDGWFGKVPAVEVKVQDNKSGIKQIDYIVKKEEEVISQDSFILDNKLNTSYEFMVDFTNFRGLLSLKVIVIDNAGNETTKEVVIKIDDTKPQPPKVATDYDGAWTNKDIVYKIRMSKEDECKLLSGILRYEYRVFQRIEGSSNGKWTNWEEVENKEDATLVISGDKYQGEGKVQFRAVSNSGIEGDFTEKYEFKIDTEMVNKSKVSFDESISQVNGWYRAKEIDAKISIEKEVNRSKNGFRYRVDKGEWSDYIFTEDEIALIDIKITGEGKHILEVHSVDEAGNALDAEPEVYEIKLDNTPPKINENKIEFKEKKKSFFEKLANLIFFGIWFNDAVDVIVLAEDSNGDLDVSGVDKIAWYTENENGQKSKITEREVNIRTNEVTGEKEYYIQFEIPKDFKGSLYLKAIDKANNAMDWMKVSEEIGIETEIPSVEVNVEGSSYINRLGELWYNGDDIKVTVKAWDNGPSGLKQVEYKIGSEHNGVVKDSSEFQDGQYYKEFSWKTDNGRDRKIIVKAEDKAGNITPDDKSITTVNIDRNKPPVPTVSIMGGYSDEYWTKEYVEIQLNASYNLDTLPSGIEGYKYIDMAEGEWKFIPAEENSSTAKLVIDKNGFHRLRFVAVSGAGLLSEETGEYIIKIDKIAPSVPVININDTVIPKGDKNENIWYNDEKVRVYFSVEVDEAGNTAPNHVQYSLDDGQTYEEAISLEGEGNKGMYYVDITGEKMNKIKVKTVDEAMNESEIVEFYVNIDTTKPEIESITYKPKHTSVLAKVINVLTFGNFFNEELEVTVKAKDNHPGKLTNQMSGIDTITYYTAKDAEGTEMISDYQTVTPNSNGEISFILDVGFEGYVFVKAKDKANNEMGEFVRKGTNIVEGSVDTDKILVIERENPNIQVTTSPATGELVDGWYNGKVKVHVEVTDIKSGINIIKYTLGNGEEKIVDVLKDNPNEMTTYMEFDLIWDDEDGEDLPISITVVDNAGNEVTKNDVTVNIDKKRPSSPSIKVTYIGRINGDWTNADIVYSVDGNADSIHSGISKYEYEVLGENESSTGKWQTLELKNGTTIGELRISKEGTSKIKFRTVSGSGLIGEETAFYIAKIDKTAPAEAKVTIDDVKPQDTNWYRASSKLVKLEVGQENDRSQNSTWYSLDGSAWKQGTLVTVSGDNIHTLQVQTRDGAGNSSPIKTYKINLDKTAPTINKSDIVFTKKNTSAFSRFMNFISFGQFYNEEISVTITAIDATSGVDKIIYYATEGDKVTKVIPETVVTNKASNKNSLTVKFNLKPNFKGYVFAKAVDIAGNEMGNFTQSVGVVVEDKNLQSSLPKIEIIPQNKPNSYGFYNGDVVVNLKVQDFYSGINNVKYTVGSEPEQIFVAPNTDRSEMLTSWTKQVIVPSARNNSNNVKVSVTVEDNAGNIKTETISLKIDITPPKLTIDYYNNNPANQKYFKDNRTATVTVEELNFNPADVKINITRNGAAIASMVPSPNAWRHNGNIHTISIPFTVDGEYRVDVAYTDMAGNRGNTIETQSFVIDKTLPVINVEYDNNAAENNNYFKANRTATITIKEVNFRADDVKISMTATKEGNPVQLPTVSGWRQEGTDTHTATINFTTDADYTLHVAYSDLANNAASNFATQSFVIDKVKPEVSISGVKDLSANKEGVAPVISFSDINLDLQRSKVVLKGTNTGSKVFTSKTSENSKADNIKLETIEIDDNYVLTADIYDKSGNLTTTAVSFSVNKNGSTFDFIQKDYAEGKYVNSAFKPSIKISNVDAVEIVSLTLNGKAVSYSFENGVLEFDEEIQEEGKQVIELIVRDAAGNVNNKTIEFFYDATKPKNIITGVEDGKVYFDTLTINIIRESKNDKIKMLKLNDKDLTEADYTVNEDGSITLVLTDFMDYKLSFQTVDEAGNESDVIEYKFTITDNLLIKFYETKPLFYGTIAGVAVVIVAVVCYLMFFRRSKKIA